MKKILALFFTIVFIIGTLKPVLAENTSAFSDELNIGKGIAKEIKFDASFDENISIDFEYDLTDKTWTNDCNIPFIIMSGSTEIGRVSIYSRNAELLNTRIENGSIINTGTISRKGILSAEIDFKNEKIVYKCRETAFRKEGFLFETPFRNTADYGITGVKIGASANPGVFVKINVYKGISDKKKTVYDFESKYDGDINNLSDFINTSAGAALANDPINSANRVLKVPQNAGLNMVLLPINSGFSGTVRVKARLYIEADSFGGINPFQIQEYITGKTTAAVNTLLASENTFELTGTEKKSIKSNSSYLNRWINAAYIINTENNTARVWFDNKAVTGDFEVPDISIINKIYCKNPKGNLYLDDVEIENLDWNKEYTVTGAEIVNSPYGREGKCAKSNTVSAVKFYDMTGAVSVDFMMCMENNTSFTTVGIFNENNKEIAKLYLNNQETISMLVGNSAYTHIISTRNKEWVNVRADIDTENETVCWYINHRPLQTEPLPLTNMYDGNKIINKLQISVNKGAYVYIDDVDVYSTKKTDTTVISDKFEADNEYSMITNVPYGTTVGEFIDGCAVYGSDNIQKSENEYIIAGDTAVLSDGKKYAIGLTGSEIPADVTASEYNIFVSMSGNDNNSGEISEPLASLDAAIKRAGAYNGTVNINICGGEYYIDKTISLSDCKNINIRAYNGENVIFIGGKRVNNSDFLPVVINNTNVLCADISGFDTGNYTQAGWNLPFVQSCSELIKNGQTQTTARYPNEGYIKSGNEITGNSQGIAFKYNDNRIESWRNIDNVRIWGFFGVDYGGHDVEIKSLNTADKIIETNGTIYNVPQKAFDYYYSNVLEELDCPGEYYIDTQNEKLYYYPDSDFETSRFVLSSMTEPLIRLEKCKDINIDGISLEGGRGNGIEVSGSINVCLKNMKINGFGMNGAEISGGASCGMDNCEISYTGGDAVKLYGGDIYTLSPAGHYVRNCDIHDFSKRKTSYTSAVTTAGDGFEISGNKIHSAPHTGLFLRSSDTEIHDNKFSDLTYNAKDMGAVYSVDTYTRRGVNIYNNTFDNIKNKYNAGTGLVKCIYLDNFTSGWNIHNNIFRNSDEGIHMNGGRENNIENNIFINTKFPLGIYNLVSATFTSAPYYQSILSPVNSKLWTEKFVGINEFTAVNKGYPNNSFIGINTIAGAERLQIDDKAYMTVSENNIIGSDYVTNNGRISSLVKYEKYIKPFENGILSDGVIIGNVSPLLAEVYIPKGESREVLVRTDGEMKIPDKITSSNEIRVSVKNNTVYAVNGGAADINVYYGDEVYTVNVVTDSYRMNK